MGGKDQNYTIVYRGDFIESVPEGRWLIIQRAKLYGGGYWLGKAYSDCFWLEFEKPMSLSECMQYVAGYDLMISNGQYFEEEFKLV
ncbi:MULTISPECIES: lF-82 [Klebsiella/Raoultella group]|uniref:lF-82 n=1 Tax=Klebsiella/Raoultella group TaxID=2890311 RepID=UPI000BFF2847|nr:MULTISPECIES: lF-82 [Klebsiella/Raoultella group]EJR0225025.1 lF-82 [Raoultella planticola]ATM20421.1 lF-82 [Raoultella ornithinolytica]EJR0354733.1 lF-82 [Raoultella planticola]MDC7940309.1 lF-82 [Raoultella ornithinolytica]MEB2971880.1 lF-82 [Klebsiella pneumoniae]